MSIKLKEGGWSYKEGATSFDVDAVMNGQEVVATFEPQYRRTEAGGCHDAVINNLTVVCINIRNVGTVKTEKIVKSAIGDWTVALDNSDMRPSLFTSKRLFDYNKMSPMFIRNIQIIACKCLIVKIQRSMCASHIIMSAPVNYGTGRTLIAAGTDTPAFCTAVFMGYLKEFHPDEITVAPMYVTSAHRTGPGNYSVSSVVIWNPPWVKHLNWENGAEVKHEYARPHWGDMEIVKAYQREQTTNVRMV